MISHRRVKHPDESPHTELDEDRSIAPRNRISNCPRDAVERNVIHTEAPDEIINVFDVLLVGFRRE